MKTLFQTIVQTEPRKNKLKKKKKKKRLDQNYYLHLSAAKIIEI